MPRTATVGPEIYRRVNELVGEGKRRGDAIAQVAEERGQRPGAVSTNYYRVARAEKTSGRTSRRRRTSATATTRTSRRRTPTATMRTATLATPAQGLGGISELASRISDLTGQLVSRLEARDAELRRLLG